MPLHRAVPDLHLAAHVAALLRPRRRPAGEQHQQVAAPAPPPSCVFSSPCCSSLNFPRHGRLFAVHRRTRRDQATGDPAPALSLPSSPLFQTPPTHAAVLRHARALAFSASKPCFGCRVRAPPFDLDRLGHPLRSLTAAQQPSPPTGPWPMVRSPYSPSALLGQSVSAQRMFFSSGRF